MGEFSASKAISRLLCLESKKVEVFLSEKKRVVIRAWERTEEGVGLYKGEIREWSWV